MHSHQKNDADTHTHTHTQQRLILTLLNLIFFCVCVILALRERATRSERNYAKMIWGWDMHCSKADNSIFHNLQFSSKNNQKWLSGKCASELFVFLWMLPSLKSLFNSCVASYLFSTIYCWFNTSNLHANFIDAVTILM